MVLAITVGMEVTNMLEKIIACVQAKAAAGVASFEEAMAEVWDFGTFEEVSDALGAQGDSNAIRARLGALFEEAVTAYRRAHWQLWYTTAPQDYDWSWAHNLGVVAWDKRSKKAYRKVLLEPTRADAQISRYYSGIHGVFNRKSFEQLVTAGLVDRVKVEYPTDGYPETGEFEIEHPVHGVLYVSDGSGALQVTRPGSDHVGRGVTVDAALATFLEAFETRPVGV